MSVSDAGCDPSYRMVLNSIELVAFAGGLRLMRIDLHQHVWTEPLLEALEQRDRLPFVRRVDGLTVLHSAGEHPYIIDVASEAPARRAELVSADGLHRAVIAISSPIGIEALPREEAVLLIEAHLRGVEALGPKFAAWGPVALVGLQPDDVDRLVARGCVGISLPAGALDGADALDTIGPLLERVAARGVPLFVHPGPAPGTVARTPALSEPSGGRRSPTTWRKCRAHG